MGDWPALFQMPPPGVVTTGSTCSLVSDPLFVRATSTTAGGVWPTANRAFYMPFIIERISTAYQMAFEVTVQSGNCDVGIYDELGNRIVSQGSTAVGAAGIQKVDIADTVLKPRLYYMAMCVDNITAAFLRFSGPELLYLRVCGMQQQDVGAVTLPNPATFTNPTATYLPVLAVALKSVI